MKKRKEKFRLLRCIWLDIVDLGFWLVTIGLFVQYLIRFGWEHMANASRIGIPTGFLALVIFYFYFAMYRRTTFAQERYKFKKYIEDKAVDRDLHSPDEILNMYDDV